MNERIRNAEIEGKVCTAEAAAALITDGMTVGTSGFTGIGYPKVVPGALAKRAEAGEKVGITLITGASVGDELDGVLARAGVLRRRYPYQTNNSIRDAINRGEIHFADQHLSRIEYWLRQGFYGKVDMAIIEASQIKEDGSIVPVCSVGIVATLARVAEKVIIELNTSVPLEIEGLHDIYNNAPLPYTRPIPITRPGDRIGSTAVPCDPDKIAAVVMSDKPNTNRELQAPDDDMKAIAGHLITFLEGEMKAGRLPDPLPPLQSGIGGVANAILAGLADSDLHDLTVYTEVMQDAILDLIDLGKIKSASATSITISPSKVAHFYENIKEYKKKIVLRPQEITNSPEVISRLGVIAMNTAIEADMAGNVNSTHIGGTRLMNGLGGSGDFARNAGITIFTTASTAKNGTLSCIVPSVTHIDHTEHDVQIIITEQGLADLRGLDPYERAEVIISNCAHPKFRDELRASLESCRSAADRGHDLPLLRMK